MNASTEPAYSPAPERLLLDVRETAKRLSISPRSLWAQTAPRGPIPSVRLGSRVLYSLADLQSWISEQKIGSNKR